MKAEHNTEAFCKRYTNMSYKIYAKMRKIYEFTDTFLKRYIELRILA